MPNSVPIDAGLSPRRDSKTSGITGSSIAIVAAAATIRSAQIAIGRSVSTFHIDAAAAFTVTVAGVTIVNTIRSIAASAATTRNGRRMPPISYNQPPSSGPMMMPRVLPPIARPMARPRSSSA